MTQNSHSLTAKRFNLAFVILIPDRFDDSSQHVQCSSRPWPRSSVMYSCPLFLGKAANHVLPTNSVRHYNKYKSFRWILNIASQAFSVHRWDFSLGFTLPCRILDPSTYSTRIKPLWWLLQSSRSIALLVTVTRGQWFWYRSSVGGASLSSALYIHVKIIVAAVAAAGSAILF